MANILKSATKAVKSTLITALHARKHSGRGLRRRVKSEEKIIKDQPITEILLEKDGGKAEDDTVQSQFDQVLAIVSVLIK